MQNIGIPLVTVILTVFRRTGYLERAIQSVVSQSLTSWECIVTDDANTTAAKEICARFNHDPRLRYRSNQSPLGTPPNVATALREARGRYVTILNDDDLMYPLMLEHLIGPMEENNQITAAFGNHEVIDANGVILPEVTETLVLERGRKHLKAGLVPDQFSFAVQYGLMVVMGCVFRRSVVDLAWLVSEVRGAYDYWLPVKLSEVGELFFVPENVMAWRRHGDSVTATVTVSPDIYAGEIYIFGILLAKPLKPPLDDYVRRRLSELTLVRGLLYLEKGWSVIDARKCFYDSWNSKWSFVAYRYWISTFFPTKVRQFSIQFWQNIRSTLLRTVGR
jgi:glycosyltransferase involved in cell wall biosynthesis